MRRWTVLGVLVTVGALSLIITANQQQDERFVEVEQLEDNLFVLRGGGGNSAVFVTSDRVVLVDTKMAGWGRLLLDKITELTPNPVTTIINTHTHFDHMSGNVEFPATVDIVGHENTQRLMREWNLIAGFGFAGDNVFDASDGRGITTRTFRDRMTLGSGADQIDLYYFGRGHTGGDAWVVFPSLRTVHAGDMFPSKTVPVMDANNGGSGVGPAFAVILGERRRHGNRECASGQQRPVRVCAGHQPLDPSGSPRGSLILDFHLGRQEQDPFMSTEPDA